MLLGMLCVREGERRSPTSCEYKSNIKYTSVKAASPQLLTFRVEF